MRILLATHNPGKRREIASFLAGIPLEIIHLGDLDPLPECEEDGATFLENAVKKARHYWELTQIPTLADDSGLTINALDGFPGVHSARFAGPQATDQQRVEKILEEMSGISDDCRQATFVCVLAFCRGDDDLYALEERAEGIISRAPAGSGGFGYDPIFFVPALQKTFAELPPAQKNQISHRGKALTHFRDWLLGDIPR